MDKLLYILALIIVIGYYGEKWIRHYRLMQKSKFKDTKAEFTADLFKLQSKWANRGEYDLVQLLDMLKEGLHLPPEEKLAETEYGKQFQKDIKEVFTPEN